MLVLMFANQTSCGKFGYLLFTKRLQMLSRFMRIFRQPGASAFLLLSCVTSLAQTPVRQVAVTIDDLPTVNIVGDTDEARLDATQRLLKSLADRKIPAIGFVNESKLYDGEELVPARLELLREWLDGGFDLGNHSFSHPDLHRVPLEEFKLNALKGEHLLRPLLAESGKVPEYFRHPYLHTGRSLGIKTDFETFLGTHDYKVAPVSIDNSEWIFARAYLIARQQENDELADRIARDYIDYMLRVFEFYEDQSAQLFERNISHVLLIHANELNADWFGNIADQLSNIGYEFISLDDALRDSAYQMEDTYTGPSGITWIHRWAMTQQVDPAMFQGEPETPEYIMELANVTD
jgi:peptidoglycan/xylan/chitin deacetylase (PgdA/CDA1 family)